CGLMLSVTPSASVVHTPSSMTCRVRGQPPFAFNTSFTSWEPDRSRSCICPSRVPRNAYNGGRAGPHVDLDLHHRFISVWCASYRGPVLSRTPVREGRMSRSHRLKQSLTFIIALARKWGAL